MDLRSEVWWRSLGFQSEKEVPKLYKLKGRESNLRKRRDVSSAELIVLGLSGSVDVSLEPIGCN